MEDIKFRIEAAARVLERAADRTNDIRLREWLLGEARKLRELAEKKEIGLITIYEHRERNKTIDDIMNEIREFIWRDIKQPRHESPRPEEDILVKPVEALEQRINQIIEAFEEKIKKFDELLGLIP